MMAARYLLQRKEITGVWRSPYGSGVTKSRWKTVSKHDSEESATERFMERRGRGLSTYRIMYRGDILNQS